MTRTSAVLAACLALVAQAFAFEFTMWAGDHKKDETPKSKCWSSGALNGRNIPNNKHAFVGSLSTQSDEFTLLVDGNPITLPMTPKLKKNPKKSPTKYRIGQPTPGQVAQLELSVQAILRQKLGDADFVVSSVTVSTRTSTHKLKSKFTKVKTQIRLSWTGTSPQGTWKGRLKIRFRGLPGSG